MKNWGVRIAVIVVVAALVATALPGIKERRAAGACVDSGAVYDYASGVCRTDVQSLPAGSIPFFQAPDRGSVMLAMFVTLALLRLFVTVDRRARSRAVGG